jgi:protein-S-isoprenylcysteine O-methyltransferase Ste14
VSAVLVLLLKNLLFTVVAPATVAGYVPFLMTRGRSPASGAVAMIAYLLIAVGALIYLRCVWDFLSFGRATPAPIDAPKKLVVRALYRYVRNPMYVGVLTAILGWALLFRALDLLLYGLVVFTCFHLFVTLYEEPHLQRVFGQDYDGYRARVGRWLPRPARRPD